jgi:hypothetical protein
MCTYAQSYKSKGLWRGYVIKLTQILDFFPSYFLKTKIFQKPGHASFIPRFWMAHSPSLPLLRYIHPYTYCHFNPEDGDSMLLWNVGIYQWADTVPKPRTVSLIHSDVMLLFGTPSCHTDIFYFNNISLLIYTKAIEIPGIWTFWHQ